MTTTQRSSTRRSAVTRRALALAALLGLAALIATVWLERRGYLVGDHEVDVQLRFVGPAPDILTDVTVILDADKFNRAWLRPGEPERVTMVPVWNGGDLTLLFTLRGERTSWQGPALPEGGGYRIALDIGGEGRVQERHCLLPCPPW